MSKWERLWRYVSNAETVRSLLALTMPQSFISGVVAVIIGIWSWLISQPGPAIAVYMLTGFTVCLLAINQWNMYQSRKLPTQKKLITGIDWSKLSSSLKELHAEHSGVTLFYVSGRRPLAERLRSVFELAGWKTDFISQPYDGYGAHWSYVEGIQVKGRSRIVVESVSNQLKKAGAKNVFAIVEENDGGAGLEHVNWKSISRRVTIMVGHEDK